MYQNAVDSRGRGKICPGETVDDLDIPKRIIENGSQGIGFGMNQEFGCGFGLHD